MKLTCSISCGAAASLLFATLSNMSESLVFFYPCPQQLFFLFVAPIFWQTWFYFAIGVGATVEKLTKAVRRRNSLVAVPPALSKWNFLALKRLRCSPTHVIFRDMKKLFQLLENRNWLLRPPFPSVLVSTQQGSF